MKNSISFFILLSLLFLISKNTLHSQEEPNIYETNLQNYDDNIIHYATSIDYFIFSENQKSLIINQIEYKNQQMLIKGENLRQSEYLRTTDICSPVFVLLFAIWPLNPIVLHEDEKFQFGLTKEFSIWKFNYGRIAFEYSRIFRGNNKNHYRFSYNYDIPLGDKRAHERLSIGVGYFTDTENKGFFPQISYSYALSVCAPFGAFIPNAKLRYTFMSDENKSNIFDISAGVGFFIFF